jgi:molybdopterin-binding protein
MPRLDVATTSWRLRLTLRLIFSGTRAVLIGISWWRVSPPPINSLDDGHRQWRPKPSPKLAEMRVPLANLRISDNEGDGEAVIKADDNGPLAGVSIDLDGHGHLFALATRKVIDELALCPGDRVFALVKSVALDERAVATVE